MVLEQLNIFLPKMSGHDFLVGDVADFHIIVRRQRHRHNVLAVEGLVNHAAANGVAVEPNEQVKQRGPVADLNVLSAAAGGEYLFGEIEGIVLPFRG